MRGVFVDANESLAGIFERLQKPGDPAVTIHRDPDITPEQYPAILDGAEIRQVRGDLFGSATETGVKIELKKVRLLCAVYFRPEGAASWCHAAL